MDLSRGKILNIHDRQEIEEWRVLRDGSGTVALSNVKFNPKTKQVIAFAQPILTAHDEEGLRKALLDMLGAFDRNILQAYEQGGTIGFIEHLRSIKGGITQELQPKKPKRHDIKAGGPELLLAFNEWPWLNEKFPITEEQEDQAREFLDNALLPHLQPMELFSILWGIRQGIYLTSTGNVWESAELSQGQTRAYIDARVGMTEPFDLHSGPRMAIFNRRGVVVPHQVAKKLMDIGIEFSKAQGQMMKMQQFGKADCDTCFGFGVIPDPNNHLILCECMAFKPTGGS